jgi:hypothetical protein
MSEFKEFEPECIECGAKCKYEFAPTIVQFALKDGPSGSWPSKGNRFKKYREEQSKAAEKRQRDRYGNPAAVPNYKGQETGTWAEAQSQARADKDNPNPEATAATYTDKVATEKVIKTS